MLALIIGLSFVLSCKLDPVPIAVVKAAAPNLSQDGYRTLYRVPVPASSVSCELSTCPYPNGCDAEGGRNPSDVRPDPQFAPMTIDETGGKEAQRHASTKPEQKQKSAHAIQYNHFPSAVNSTSDPVHSPVEPSKPDPCAVRGEAKIWD